MRTTLILLAAASALTACTSATIQTPDGSKISFTRAMTAAGVRVRQAPDGTFLLDYSSDPQAQAANQLLADLTRLLALAGPVAGGANWQQQLLLPKELSSSDY